MQVVATRRRVGFLMIAIAVLLASFVVVAPRVQATGEDTTHQDSGDSSKDLSKDSTDSNDSDDGKDDSDDGKDDSDDGKDDSDDGKDDSDDGKDDSDDGKDDDDKPVVVKIVQGDCDWRNGGSETDVTFTFRYNGVDVSGKVELTVTGPTGLIVITEKTETELRPGRYLWTAKSIDEDYVVEEPSSGEFMLGACPPEPELIEVDVTVNTGECVWDGKDSLTGVSVSIKPDGGAIVQVDGIEYTFDGQTLAVGPGEHTWTASARDGYELDEGASGGEFTTETCVPPSSLGDTVWEDLDGNGLQDAGEPGIENIDVSLMNGENVVVATTSTDGHGKYLFDGLEAGDYSVAFLIPEPWVVTTQDAGDDSIDNDANASGVTASVTLAPGASNLTVDAGLILPATITVKLLTDPVALDSFAFTGDIEADLANEESASSIVLPGSYRVVELVPDGWALVDITCDEGGSGDIDSASASYTVISGDSVTCTYTNTSVGTIVLEKATDVATTDRFDFKVGEEPVNLGSGESVELEVQSGTYTITELVAVDWDLVSIVCSGESKVDGNSVSLIVPAAETVGCTFVNTKTDDLGVVGDYVWDDVNANGIQDATEVGVGRIEVRLMDGDHTAIASTMTNPTGVYLFLNVPAGSYNVQFTVPAGWRFTTPNAGSDGLDSDVIGATGQVGQTAPFSLGAGEVETSIDAGVVLIPASPPPPEITTPPPTVPDTVVAGVKTTLPMTGLDDWQGVVLAVALMLAGGGVLLVVRKEEDILFVWTGGGGDWLGL